MAEARSEPSPIPAREMSVPHSQSTRLCCATLALCLGEYRKRYACDSGLDVAQEYRTYVRCPELAPERFKDFGGRGVLRWAGVWIVTEFERYSTRRANV